MSTLAPIVLPVKTGPLSNPTPPRGYLAWEALAREVNGDPAADFRLGPCQFAGPTPVEALTDSRDFGEMVEERRAVPHWDEDTEVIDPAEIAQARGGSGHGYGQDYEEGSNR